MFKARKKNPKLNKGNLRKKKDDDDEEDVDENDNQDESTQRNDDDDNTNTEDAIARIKKKRKLLHDNQYKKGTNAAALLKGRTDDDPTKGDATTSATTDQKTTASSSQEGIMEQKHKQALEDYVEAKLADIVGENNNNNNKTSSDDGDTEVSTSQQVNGPKLTKEELYKQLAQTSESLVGRRSASGDDPSNTNTNNNNDADGDVGTGGAMLVAGTGLAEVILPVHERLKAVAATQEAAVAASGPARHRNANKGTYFGMPQTNQHSVPAGTARFQVSAADKHRHFASNSNRGQQQQQQQQQQDNNPSTNAATTQETPEEQGRMGFDARQGKVAAGTHNTNAGSGQDSKHKNSNNSNQYANKNTRASDDKVYGKFIKKQRDNQRRGR